MTSKRITVVGGGNGAHAAAADLALRGFAVTLFELPPFAANVEVARTRGYIEFENSRGVQRANLAKVTTDAREAVSGADWLIVAVPSFGHAPVAQACAPHLRDGQNILIFAATFGSLIFRRALSDAGCQARVNVGESSTLPYGARLKAPGLVTCPLLAERVSAAAFPSQHQDSYIRDLQQIYPVITGGANVLEIALSNVNPIVHPVATLLNAGRIEYANGDFFLYEEGITKSVARAIRALHFEFTQLGRALGTEPAQYEEKAFEKRTTITSTEFRAEFDTERVVSTFKGPFDVKNDRYVSEDVPYGLVPVASIAKMIGVEVPTVLATIQLFSVINQVDYWRDGWTVEKLGIAGLNLEELRTYFRTGEVGATASALSR
jgi:opine dehydrogenase